MLTPRLTNYIANSTIPVLLVDINERIAYLANLEYNNLVFAVNNYINTSALWDLLNYKRILLYKNCNPDYCINFTVEMIASRVKILIHR
jgi:uncharacterized membrane protein